MTKPWSRLPTAILFTFLTMACGSGETADAPQQPAQGLPPGHPPIAGGNVTVGNNSGGGVVLETMDAGGYTYARLGASGQEIWVAGPVTALEVGDTVQIVNPMSMGAFTSKALDRTFESLYFVDAFKEPAVSGPSAGAHPGAGGVQAVIEETMDAGGYTYVRVVVDDEDVWLAGPQTALQEGQTVTWSGGTLMRNFTSNTLNKTFEQIYFVTRLTPVEGG